MIFLLVCLVLKDESSYAILDKAGVKVNKQTDSLTRYFEIG